MKTYILLITEIDDVRTARTTVIQNGTIETDLFEYGLDEEDKFVVPEDLDLWQTEFIGNRPNDRG